MGNKRGDEEEDEAGKMTRSTGFKAVEFVVFSRGRSSLYKSSRECDVAHAPRGEVMRSRRCE